LEPDRCDALGDCLADFPTLAEALVELFRYFNFFAEADDLLDDVLSFFLETEVFWLPLPKAT